VTTDRPLISVPELAAHLQHPDAEASLRVCDVRWYLAEPGRGRREYDAGHIPAAIFIDTETVLTGPSGPGRHPLPDPRSFASALGELGIGGDHMVVAYDDPGATLAAARLWWMLDDLGHDRVRLLDGGWAAWITHGGAVSIDEPTHPPARLVLADRWRGVIDRERLRERLGSVVLLDARAGERYRGEIEPIDPVAGHIPTAVSAPNGENLDPDGRFLPPDRLHDRFAALGCSDREVVTSCGSGVTACHNALAMRIAGLPDPLLYPGSYSDWSRSDEPVATGPEPGGWRRDRI
jgi:thiosulfate/3-mercaptopyruvate sulfurtransferase